jgi:predicted negative regulator of RcsB-dependent stress response
MKKRFLFTFALLWCAPVLVLAQAPTAASPQVDARAEVAAALYAASATQAVVDRVADAKLRTQRAEIERLRAEGRASLAAAAQLRGALTVAEEAYVAALAARDQAYAQEIAVFRAAVQDIAATPEGAAALARFNAGDESGALAILDNLRTARDAARRKRANIESAAEGRRIAALALEARVKGKLTTAQVIARYEELTRLDPGVYWDWVQLARLFRDAGKLADSLRATLRAEDAALDYSNHAITADELGDVLSARGDRPGALAAYRKGLGIREVMVARDPANTGWQRDLSVSQIEIGDVLLAQGNGPGALAAYRKGLEIQEALAARNPANTGWQRDLSVSYIKIGDVLLAQGNGPGALASYRKALEIQEALAARDPSNTELQRDLSISHNKIGDVLVAQGDGRGALAAYRKGLAIAETLAARCISFSAGTGT